VLIALALACGGRPHWPGDPTMYGVDLVVGTDPGMPAFVSAPDFRDRVKRDLELSARYFGRDPAELAGLRVVFVVLGVRCPGYAGFWLGCYDNDTNTIAVDTTLTLIGDRPCVERAMLSHELLHYFIGDGAHTDPRWRQFGPLWDALMWDRQDCWTPYQDQWQGRG